MQKAALLSVSNRSGLVEFARGLAELGYVLLVTSGTSKALKGAGVSTISIEEYTGQREILDGRVKTLHPRIHAGLLACRDNAGHMRQLEQDGILPIEIVAANLYPFIENLQKDKMHDPAQMVELIDIGGPSMLRAAAKNFRSVWTVIDPADYPRVLGWLKEPVEPGALEMRHRLAVKVFAWVANYDLEIAKYLCHVHFEEQGGGAGVCADDDFFLGEVSGQVLFRQQALRYGENPHQRAAFYRTQGGEVSWRQLHGKELSYNNLLDFSAAWNMVRALSGGPAAVIVKHLNPCGAALDNSLQMALQRAKRGDVRSHFGGIIACNVEVDHLAAEEITKDFCEMVVAPGYSEEALDILRNKSNLRVIGVLPSPGGRFELRSIDFGVLIQERDQGVARVTQGSVVSKRHPAPSEIEDLQLAWMLCAHVKSNAVVFVKDKMLLAAGAGQTSRIDAAEVAVAKCAVHGHNLQGAVAASDAFFPFEDCLELMAKKGISAVVAPSGAKRDHEVVAAADRFGLALIFMGERHFKH